MKLHALHLHHVRMPLVSPFTTSFSTQTEREMIVVEAETDAGIGWGEIVTMPSPLYNHEYTDGVAEIVERFLAPVLSSAANLSPERVGEILAPVVGHRMSKAGIEMAMLDAMLRARGQSFAEYLGGIVPSVPSGVSVGIQDSIPRLLESVERYLDEGYARVKLKIMPGWDLEPVRRVRERFGDDILLQVDANAAYRLSDASHLRRLDAFDLLLIEQPLAEDDLREHAELARVLTTPICLDESIVSAKSAVDAIVTGAARVINIKPGRVGGYLEARRIHDLARAHGIAVWCGGMLETGIGRAANAALASLPGFSLPGDISASARFYTHDIVAEPLTLHEGAITVPTGPGFGVDVDRDALDAVTTRTSTITVDAALCPEAEPVAL